jgi:uncharacterized membrane protein
VFPVAIKITKLKVPGVRIVEAYGINNAGAIVGGEIDRNNVVHGFMLKNGKLARIDPPHAQFVQVNGINSDNDIVGTFMDLQDRIHGFLYSHKKFTDIGPASTLGAWGINDQGWVVGGYGDGTTIHGWVWDRKKYRSLDVPGSTETIATAINDGGEILLAYIPPGKGFYQAATFDGEKYTKLDVPGAEAVWPGGINNSGDITITWGDLQRGAYRGGLFHKGKFFRFDAKNSAITVPIGINDRHRIVGRYMQKKSGSGYFGFTATYRK